MRYLPFLILLAAYSCTNTGQNNGKNNDSLAAATPATVDTLATVVPMPVTDSFATDIKTLQAASQKLNSVVAAYEQAPQVFPIPMSKPTKVVGKNGTVILVNSDDLSFENGDVPITDIKFELREVMNTEQLLTSRAQTVSNGKLLVSDGAYYINVTSQGEQLRLRPGKTLKVYVPKKANPKDELFTGNRDALGNMNWTLVSSPAGGINKADTTAEDVLTQLPPGNYRVTKNQLDSILSSRASRLGMSGAMTKEMQDQIAYNKFYSSLSVTSLGWINCDRFLKEPQKTNCLVQIDGIEGTTNAEVFLVFKDINSAMQSFCYKDKEGLQTAFNNIPVNYKVRLIAYTMKKDKLYGAASDFAIKPGEQKHLDMKEISKDDLHNMITAKAVPGGRDYLSQ